METTKLTIRVEKSFLDGAKRFASTHDTSLSRLISDYLRKLALQEGAFQETPILQELRGTLPQDTALEDYHAYLSEKYGGDDADFA